MSSSFTCLLLYKLEFEQFCVSSSHDFDRHAFKRDHAQSFLEEVLYLYGRRE